MELFPSDYKQDCVMYKKQSQEIIQKSGLPPVYKTLNEGFAHAPKFRSTVLVGNSKFTSQLTFPDQKAAEQDVVKLAYESMKNYKPELGPLHVQKVLILCKSILHEYAIKINHGIPKYETSLEAGPKAAFISSIHFAGKTYTGEVAQSKKMAEQLVARAAIQSLLVSDSGTLARVIKSKEKLYAGLHVKKDSANVCIIPKVSVEKPGNFQKQHASIQSEVITYNAGHGAFPTPRSVMKRKTDFKPKGRPPKNARVACNRPLPTANIRL